MSEWAPYSFEFINVKIVVFLLQMNQLNVFFDFILSMGKRAKIPIFTFINVFGIVFAKFGFVSIRVVELFKFVVSGFTVFVITLFF